MTNSTSKRVTAAKPAAETAQSSVASPVARTKADMLVELMSKPDGATIAQMMDVTGWQAHSVRGAISGAIKKQRGLDVLSQRSKGGERVYRLAAAGSAA